MIGFRALLVLLGVCPNLEKCVVDFLEERQKVVYFSEGFTGNIGEVKLDLEDVVYVIYSSSLHKISQFLKTKYDESRWSSKARVLVVGEVNLVDLFELLRGFYLSNAVVLTNNGNFYTDRSLRMCQPSAPKLLGRCGDRRSRFPTNTTKFQITQCTFQTYFFHNPPFQIAWNDTKDPGVFVRVNKELQKALKYSVTVRSNYSRSNVNALLENGTYLGTFKDVLEGHLDYFLGGPVKPNYTTSFGYVHLHFGSEWYFWTPVANETHQWRNLILIYSPYSWLALMVSFFAVALLSYPFTAFDDSAYGSHAYTVLAVWRVAFTANCSYPSQTSFKLLLLLWSALAFLVSSMYGGFMSAVLFLPGRDGHPKTILELLESRMQYGGSHVAKSEYAFAGTESTRRINADFVVCPGVDLDCLERGIRYGNFTLMKTVQSVAYNWKHYLDERRRPRIFGIPTGIRIDFVVFARKGHPLLESMGGIAVRFFEGGLLGKWDSFGRIERTAYEESKYKRISVEHLLLAFGALFVGHGISTAWFGVELCILK